MHFKSKPIGEVVGISQRRLLTLVVKYQMKYFQGSEILPAECVCQYD